ncbi:SHOCT domain-containing protein [Neobacillus niacini]|uniref:SHOCT domain-containing protein n=1 Tax=Neobacillus niacini TaxID=86668 RepID=UPI003B5868EF
MRKFKALFDDGIISDEEFNKRKAIISYLILSKNPSRLMRRALINSSEIDFYPLSTHLPRGKMLYGNSCWEYIFPHQFMLPFSPLGSQWFLRYSTEFHFLESF